MLCHVLNKINQVIRKPDLEIKRGYWKVQSMHTRVLAIHVLNKNAKICVLIFVSFLGFNFAIYCILKHIVINYDNMTHTAINIRFVKNRRP